MQSVIVTQSYLFKGKAVLFLNSSHTFLVKRVIFLSKVLFNEIEYSPLTKKTCFRNMMLNFKTQPSQGFARILNILDKVRYC